MPIQAHLIGRVFGIILAGTVYALSQPASAATQTDPDLRAFIRCLKPVHPVDRIKRLLDDSIIDKTPHGGEDGMPLFIVTGKKYLFGMRVLGVMGFDDDNIRANLYYTRAPGTLPPTFVSVYVEASQEQVKRIVDKLRSESFAVYKSEFMEEFYPNGSKHDVTAIICYPDESL
jgi:hypothetical protein